MNSEVPLGDAKSPQRISAQVPLSKRVAICVSRGRCECYWVKRLAARVLRSIQIDILSWHHIWPNLRRKPVELEEGTLVDVNWCSGVCLNYVWRDQPPRSFWRMGPTCGVGMSYVAPAEKA